MTMTFRSTNQQTKSFTISQGLRDCADQKLAIQPPKIPHLRTRRSRRVAATSSSPRHISVNYQTEAHTPVWDATASPDPSTRSNTTDSSGFEQNAATNRLLSPLDFIPLYSPRRSQIHLDSSLNQQAEAFDTHPNPHSHLIPPPLPSVTESHSDRHYELPHPAQPNYTGDSPIVLQDMSTLSYMMPAQYGMGHYAPEHQGYASMGYPDTRVSPPPPQEIATSGSYVPSYVSSAAQEQKTRVEHIVPAYDAPPAPRSQFDQAHLGPLRASPPLYPSSTEAPLNSNPNAYPFPPVQLQLPLLEPGLGQLASSASYPPPLYPPVTYEVGGYNSLPPAGYAPSTTTSTYPAFEESSRLPPPNHASGNPASPTEGNGVMPRVINTRPKPQCWDHGCNGRQFSTFSNLLRHQREKSGTSAKSYCKYCGAEFTRTTAKNGHEQMRKCKPNRARSSESDDRPDRLERRDTGSTDRYDDDKVDRQDVGSMDRYDDERVDRYDDGTMDLKDTSDAR